MLDSTITANGKREISGQSLNAALNAILDLVDSKSDSGFGGSAVTILIPNEDSWETDNSNIDLIVNNVFCFEALKNQTEPMLIFMKHLGAKKPYAQVAMRMRHLDDIGEGVDFFAFGYPVPYTNIDKYGILAYSDEMYKLNENGTITRIDLLGNNYDPSSQLPDIEDSIKLTEDMLIGVYSHSDDSVPSMIGQTYLPEIIKKQDGSFYIKYLFGCSSEDDTFIIPIQIDLENNTLTIDYSDVIHPVIGPINGVVVFDINNNGVLELSSRETSIVLNDWTTITNYKMTKKS